VETLISQVKFYIIYAKTLFLLSLANINKLRVYFNNLFNIIITLKGDILVIQRFKHLFLLWNTLL
jgi:alpha-N-acetylglucosamine transferase